MDESRAQLVPIRMKRINVRNNRSIHAETRRSQRKRETKKNRGEALGGAAQPEGGKRKRYTGRRHRLQSVCGICEKSSLAGLQILAGTPPRVWAFLQISS